MPELSNRVKINGQQVLVYLIDQFYLKNCSIMNIMHVYKFKSSVINGGRPFMPDIIEIDDSYVTFRKKKSIFSALHTISIPLQNIVNIKVSKSGYGVNILIESFSKSSILGKGFSASEASEIKRLLTS